MTIIYTLSCPISNEIRYVGKTSKTLNRRLSLHLADARSGKYKHHTSNWLNSLLTQSLKPIIQEIDRVEGDWEWLEIYWISQLKTWGFNLTNQTAGGIGGYEQSTNSNYVYGSHLIGKKRNKETCNNISEGKKRYFAENPISEEIKSKIRKTVVEKQGVAVVKLDLITKRFICEYASLTDAAKDVGVDYTSIRRCCEGKFKKSAGFFWMFKNVYKAHTEDMTQSNGNVVGKTNTE